MLEKVRPLFNIPINLSNSTTETVSFNWSTTAGTASTSDFGARTNQNFVYTSGSPNMIQIPITEDNLKENNENFTVTLRSLTNAMFPNGVATYTITVTITDNEGDTKISLANTTHQFSESAGTLTVRANLNHVPNLPVSVNYSTSDGTATSAGSNADFVAITDQTLRFPAGKSYAEFTITINQDTLNETNENFSIILDLPSNASFASNVNSISATATILDDEFPTLTFKTTEFKPTEEGGNFDVVVELLGPMKQAASFDVALGGGTATKFADYGNPANTTYTIPLGSTEVTITIPILSDSNNEGNETFDITLSNLTAAVLSSGTTLSQTITIVDDEDPTIKFMNSGVSVTEDISGGMANIEVNLTGTTADVVTANYTTSNGIGIGGAIAGNDYTATSSGTVTISANQLTGTIQIPILNDVLDEPNKFFYVTISSPQNAVLSNTISDSTIIVTINDDDVPTLSIEAISDVDEGPNATADFRITTDILPHNDLTIQYLPTSRLDRSAESLEALRIHTGYVPQSTTYLPFGISGNVQVTPAPLVFTPVDETNPSNTSATATLRIPLKNDDIQEVDGLVTVTLQEDSSAGVNYRVASDQNSDTLKVNDDDLPLLSISAGGAVIEGPSDVDVTVTFYVTADISPNRTIPMRVSITETGNSLFYPENNYQQVWRDFSYGVTRHNIQFLIASDEVAEMDSTVTLTLLPDQYNLKRYGVAPVPNNSASVIVYDDDSLPKVSIASENGGVVENGGPANFSLTATGLSSATTLMINATPAENGGDFLTDAIADTPTNYPVAFSDPDSDLIYTGQIPITILDNTDTGATGSIKLTLNAASTIYRLGSTTEGTIKIWDNEAPELKITAGDPVLEATNATADFVISTEISPNDHVTVRYNLFESGDFISIEGVNKSERLDFTSGKTSDTLSIPINNNTYRETDGTITVTLIADTASPIKYTLAPTPNHTANVNVIDDESLPVISIASDSGNDAENTETAQFNLTATGLTTATTLMINATPAENGHDFLTDTIASTAADFSVEFRDLNGDNTYEGILEVALNNDNVGEVSGDIKVTLNADTNPTTTYLLSSATEGTLTIFDDDTPELLVKSPGIIEEAIGGRLDFVVEARVSPNQILTVNYDLVESTDNNAGDFIAGFYEGTGKQAVLDFRGYTTNGLLSIPLSNDTEIEDESMVTVTLVAESSGMSTYTVASLPNNSAIATVLDDDQPLELSISSDVATTGVTERYPFNFTIRSNQTVSEDLDVGIYLAETTGGSGTLQPTLQGGGNKVTIPSGEQEITGTIIMATGANVPVNGSSINVAIVANPTNYAISSTAGSLSVAVKDADTGSATTPVVSLSGPTSVIKGNVATYTLTASPAPSSSLLWVSLKVDNTTGNFLAPFQSGIKRALIFGTTGSWGTAGQGIWEVRTIAGETFGQAGEISVALVEGSGYALPVSASNSSVSTNVIDPTIQTISISSNAVSTGVTERYSFEFTVSSAVNVDADLAVSVAITDENNDNLNPSLQGHDNTVTIRKGERTAVGIVDMSIGSGTNGVDSASPGQIKVAVNAVSGRYTVNSSNNEILVAVKDSDTGSTTTPVMSLNRLASVVEGTAATYTISSSHTPSNTPTLVAVKVANGSGNFLATNEARTHQVRVSAGSATFNVNTIVDSPDGDAGRIALVLEEGSGYALPRDKTQRFVNTSVVDPYVVSIAKGNDIYEGNNAKFILSATPAPASPFNVRVQFTQSGDFLVPVTNQDGSINNNPDRIKTISVDILAKEHFEQTVLDYSPEADGSVTATILPALPGSVSYRVGSTSTQTVNVANVDNYSTLPVVTLAQDLATQGVTRGYDFDIKVSIESAVNREIEVPFVIENVGNKAPSLITESGTITIPAYQTTQSQTINVNSNFTGDVPTDAKYKVSLTRHPPSFRFNTTQNGEIEIPVRDNNAPTAARPLVSISSVDSVTIGDPITFTVRASPAPTSNLSVQVQVSAIGIFVSSDQLGVRTISLTNSSPSDTFQITTQSTNPINRYGEVMAHIVQGNGYVLPIIESDLGSRTISTDAQNKQVSATVGIGAPLSVTMTAVRTSVNEGDLIPIRFTPSRVPSSDLSLTISVSETGNLLAPQTLSRKFVTLDRLTYTDVYFATQPDNSHVDEHSTVSFEIFDGFGYQLGANTTATVTITEQGVPFETISALTNHVTKGENARFQVRSDHSTSENRMVNVGLAANPTNLISTQTTHPVTILANQHTGVLSLAIPRDSNTVFDNTGTISAHIIGYDARTENVSSSNPQYSSENRSALIHVRDDDLPTGISIVAESAYIFEGEFARFSVHASDTTTSDRTINLTVSDGNYGKIDTNHENHPYTSVTIPAGESFVRLNVKTLNNTGNQSGGTITATLNSATQNLAATNRSASIVVRDRNVPTLSFAESVIRVNEGETFNMRIVADKAPLVDLPIQISELLDRASQFSFAPSNIILRAGQRSTNVVVTSIPDVSEHQSFVFEIDESADQSFAVENLDILKVIVYDTSLAPTVSISAVNTSVVEGNNARFRISLSPATRGGAPTQADVTVSFNKVGGNAFGNIGPVDENGDPIFPFTRQYNVIGSDSETGSTDHISQIIEIPTRHPDIIPDPDSSIQATIELGFGNRLGQDRYKIAPSPNNSASVSVTNETRPIIAISTVEQEVTEGSDVEFNVTVVPPGSAIAFAYQISETGNFVKPRELTRHSMTTSTNSTTLISVDTKNVDPQFQPDSLVTAEIFLVDTGDYVLSQSRSATTLVTDANTPVGGISLVAIDDSITEGENARFQIRATRRLTQAVEAVINLTNPASNRNFIASENLTQRIDFGIGERSVDFSIPTLDLDSFGLPMPITATLQANGNQYSISTGKSQDSIMVHSNDVLLSASVSVYKTFVAAGDTEPTIITEAEASTIEVTEGHEETIAFEITLSHPQNSYTFPSRGIEVDYTITQTGGDFISDAGSSTIDYSSGVTKSTTFKSLGTNVIFLNTQVDSGNTDGTITLSINNDDAAPVNYVVNKNQNNSSKSVTVRNEFNGAIPQISLSPTNIEGTSMPVTTVSEGDIWGVKLSIDPPANYPFNVAISATETGDFLSGNSNNDYVRAIRIDIGESERWYYGSIETDDVVDLDGTLTVQLVERPFYTIDTDNKTVSYAFKDIDDQKPTLTFTSQSVVVNENVAPESGATNGVIEFDVELSHAATENLVIGYTVNPGTALLNSDYRSPSSSITILEGELTGTIKVVIVDDNDTELNEHFTVTLSNNSKVQFVTGATTATGTIIDDETTNPIPVVSISNVEVAEDIESGKMTFTVELSAAASEDVNLTFTTSDGTATAGTDYTSESDETFSITNGDTSEDIMIDIMTDQIDEYNETINVQLSLTSTNAQFVGGGTSLTAIGTIRDDDQKPMLDFENIKVSSIENAGTASFVIHVIDPLTGQGTTSGKPISVKYSAMNGTAILDTDFMLTPATLNIASGSESNTIAVTLVDQASNDVNKNYTILLTEPNNARFYGQSHLAATGIIVDKNAVTPELSIADASATVAGKDVEFVVTSATPYVGELAVVYRPTKSGGNFLDESDGTTGVNRVASTDRTTTLNFTQNGSNYTAILSVATVDVSDDLDGGTITVTLQDDPANPETYTVSSTSGENDATASIIKPTIKVITARANTMEGTAAEITIEADISSPQEFTINYTPTEADFNYLTPIYQDGQFRRSGDVRSATLSFTQATPGSTDPFQATLQVPTQDSNGRVGQITVVLNNGTGYLVGTPANSMIFVRDISIPEFTIENSGQTVPGSSAQFLVTSNIPFTGQIPVAYRPVETGSSFLDESDGLTGLNKNSGEIRRFTIIFHARESEHSALLNIATEADANSPLGGTINVTLLPNTNDPGKYTVSTAPGANTAEVSVLPADQLPTLTIADLTAPETGGNISFVVTSTATSVDPLTVSYQVNQVRGNFITGLSSPGQSEAQTQVLRFSRTNSSDPYTAPLVVNVDDDAIGENSGEIRVTLLTEIGNSQTYRIVTNGSHDATATILDDDAPVISIGNAPTVSELVNANIRFPLTALVSPNASINLRYTLTESTNSGDGNFIEDAGAGGTGEEGTGKTKSIDFSNGKTKAELVIPIVSDDLVEGNSTVTVTLEAQPGTLANANYNLVSPNTPATGTIIDDDSLPLLSIADAIGSVSERNGRVELVVSTTTATSLTVRYQASEVSGGDFLTTEQTEIKTAPLTFTRAGGSGPFTDTLRVQIHNDNVQETNGSILVTLLAETTSLRTYRVNSDGSEDATAAILDDDAPRLSISGDGPITEGAATNANFTVTSAIAVTSLTVFYTSESTNFIETGSGVKTSTTLNFTTTAPYTAPLPIPVHADATSATNGTIRVTLNEESSPGTTYNVAPAPNNFAIVNITDYEGLPLVTISAPDTPVVESAEEVDFVVSSTTNLGTDFRVRYVPSEVNSGNFLNENTTPISQEDITDANIDFSGSESPYSATLSVPIHNDDVSERTGQIEVTLLGDDATVQTYRVATTGSQTAQATILDDELPELKISANDAVTEGLNVTADFTISSVVPVSTLTIFYTPVSTNFIETGSGARTSDVFHFTGLGPYTAPLTIEIHDDETAESNGTISVTLHEESSPGTSYIVAASPNNVATISVADDESLPLLTITAPTTSIAESAGSVDYVITSPTDLGSDFRVRYKPSELGSGDFLDSNATPISQEMVTYQAVDFTGSASTFTATLSVPIHDDEVGERTGQIEVVLLDDDAGAQTYRASTTGTAESKRTTILDDDAPELAITASGTIEEGVDSSANFTITSKVNVTSLTVFYTPTSSNFIQFGSGVKTSSLLTFSGNGPYTATLTIPVHDDTTSESNGPIQVTLHEESVPATNYTVAASPNNSASIQVVDDDSLPLLSISAPTTPVIESAEAVNFIITTTTNPGSNFQIRYDPSEVNSSDFLNELAIPTSQEAITTASLNFSGVPGLYSATLSVPIHNDSTNERSGQIKVELLADNNTPKTYRVATDGTQVVTATILDDEVPELKISGGMAITEGDGNTAGFTVSSVIPVTSLTVYYTPESTNFLQAGSGVETFTSLNFTGAGPYTAPLALSIHNDEFSENNGTIRVTLNEESIPTTNYTVASSPNNSAIVNVTDDDSLPLLRIAAPATPTAESAGFVDYLITATTDLGSDFQVRYHPSEMNSGDFLNELATPTSQEVITSKLIDFTASANVYTATLSVPIHNDEVGERTGQIEVELLSDNAVPKTYKVATNGTQVATATILDDDAPELKISAGNTVVEGDGNSADFTITSEVLVNTLTVYYTPVGANYMQFGSGTKTFATLSFNGEGPYTAVLPIRVHDDQTIESNGFINVTLDEESTPATNYTVASSPDNSAIVSILDDDTPPRIVVAENSGFAIENSGMVKFKLTATGIHNTETIMVNATPAEDGGDFLTDAVAGTAADFPVEFTDPDGDRIYNGELPIVLHNDNIREATAKIKLTLNPKPTTYLLGSRFEGGITVLDDDAPELKIRPGNPVIEANNVNADFVVSAEISPNKQVNVRYDLAESHDFIRTEGTGQSVELDFRNSVKEATLSIPIDNDVTSEDNGTISVTLQTDNANPIKYTVAASPNNRASVTAIDDESLITVSILPNSGSLAENAGPAQFKLSATGLTDTTTLTINATPSENGSNFLTTAIADTAVNHSVEFTDPDGDGTYSGEFPVSLHNDVTGEATGTIKLTLNNTSTDFQLGSITEGLITIWDDDAPELRITSANNVTETENLTIDYMIAAEVSPNKQLIVRYNVTETFNSVFNAGHGKIARLDFSNGATEAILPIAIVDDDRLENDSRVTVTLVADNANPITYTVIQSSANRRTVTVHDDDSPPRISIDRNSGEAIERARIARFNLSATGLTATTTLVINAIPSEDGGNYLPTGTAGTATNYSVEFTGPDDNDIYRGELMLPIDNDLMGESTASVKVSLNASPSTYRLSSNLEGTITIFDDDAPELNAEITTSTLTEGVNDFADVVITAKVSPNKIINVRYNLAELAGRNYIDNEGNGLSSPLDFSNGATEATISVPIVNDETKEDSGSISVTLIADNSVPITYTPAPFPHNIGATSILDDESIPNLSISEDNGSVVENEGMATFNLSFTNPVIPYHFNVYATITEEEGDFLLDSNTGEIKQYWVEFSDPDNDEVFHGTISVPLVNDSIGEATGKIKLTLHPDTDSVVNYIIVSTNESTITVFDDDAPELRISTVNSTITEAENATAEFMISTQISPYKNLTVRYDLAESRNFITNEGTNKTETLDFTNGKTEAILSFPLIDNSNIESSGTITATLVADNADPFTYTVAASPNNAATINVIDDESLPVISIAADNGSVAENDQMATFKLTATGLTETTTLDINATPAENGSDFLTDAVAETAADFSVEFTDPNGDGTYNGNLSVALHDDNVGEATGSIKLTLNADPDSADTFKLGSITEGLITIFDNETPELKIFGGSSIVEAENATADFVISAGASPNTNLTVRYDLTESHDFINNEGMGKTEMLDFTSNKTSATLPITIHNDGGGEPDGTITVTLVADTAPIEYLVAPSPDNSALVTIYDDDTPTIFVAADSGNVAENAGPANFKLSATGLTSTRTLTINATPAEDSSDFLTDAVATATNFMVEFTDPDGDNTYSGELAVTLHDDDDSEETGDIKLTLNPDNSATYRLGSTREGVITVYDDETPELQITAGEPVAEAQNAVANFMISVVAVPDNSLDVRYELAESHNFIANEGTNKMVTLEFTDDDKELTLPITITSDTDVEDNGTITVTLTPDNANPITYRVAPSPNNSAEVNVIDDDSLPMISITADNGDVAENTETALFSLTTTDLSAPTTLTINATPIEDGHDFLASTVESIAINYPILFTDLDSDGTYSGEFPVTLDNDNTGEATGDIKLTLNTKPTEYRLSSAIEGAITIWDDDAPELEISGGDPVIEGDNVFANFVISAEVSPNENVEIRYDLTESHSFIANEGTNKTGMLDFTNGATEATLPIAITNDTDLERNGSITVTLSADTADPITYTLAAAPNDSASISVFDDDSLPIISINADSGEVIENEGPAQFMLTATGLSATTTLAINATPAEDGGDFLTNSIANTAADFSVEFSDPDGDNTYSGELSVVIENDRIGEATGDIKLTLNTKPTVYRLSSATEGVLTIFDDDAPELQITAGNPITETTNVSANFMISAEVSPNKTINLRYNLQESHNFIDNEGNGKTASLNFSNNVTGSDVADSNYQ